jgi:hypothetical protein
MKYCLVFITLVLTCNFLFSSSKVKQTEVPYSPLVDTVQDFVSKLYMKPHMYQGEISIFSLNQVKPYKIIKDHKILNLKVIFNIENQWNFSLKNSAKNIKVLFTDRYTWHIVLDFYVL